VPPPTASAPTLVTPAGSAPAVAPPQSVAAPSSATSGTRPTVPVPQMQSSAAAPSPVTAEPRKSSITPLLAVAAVLVLLAGGYLYWAGRQPSALPAPGAASSAPADAPKAVPAA